MVDGDPDWSQEHVARGNKYFLQLALAWVALSVLSLVFAHTGVVGVVFVGLAGLVVTWLLVHALFEHVDHLVKTRIAEANGEGADESAASD